MRQKTKRNRWAAVLTVAAIALLAAPAAGHAATGGASSFGDFGGSSPGKGIAFTGWKSAGASWYGPGLYGRQTACGQTLRPRTLGVAHKTLPCGTAVKFRHRGHVLVTRVIDRGPYIDGRAWDLTEAASEVLDFESVGVGRVGYAVPRKLARKLARSSGR
jgi:rare lipoprotein A (peptidoglycan hydrolase)